MALRFYRMVPAWPIPIHFPYRDLVVQPCPVLLTAQICINIEHSYLGDLDITLTCPSGVTLTLMDTYTGGGGTTFLGDALDDGTLTPGIGLDYCWSMSAVLGTMSAENA